MKNFWRQMKIARHTNILFREMWQHYKSAQQIYYSSCFTLTLPSETRWKKATSSANFSCLLRYCVSPGGSFLSYSMSDFHCSPSANITSGPQYLAWMVIPVIRLGYWDTLPSVNVMILFHWKWLLPVFCWRMYLISYAQGIVACQWLAWLSSMFKIYFYAAMVTCDRFLAQVESVLFVFDTSG